MAYRDIDDFDNRPEAPSDNFIEAATTGGTTEIDCPGCNSHHYSLEYISWNYDDPDKVREEILKEFEESEQMHYIYYYDGVPVAEIQGTTYPIYCPCDWLVRVENFIKAHKYLIKEYFKLEVKDLKTALVASETIAILAQDLEAIKILDQIDLLREERDEKISVS